ncbi:MAG: V-type ATP synthase subunit F [Anaerovoracaceae bacterium]
MYKVCVIGDRESILGFKAVGLDVFPCDNSEDAKGILKKAAGEDFAIIYITEELAQELDSEIGKYVDTMLPAIISIPSRKGTLGTGMRNVSKAVERAVGSDILFGGEK